MNKFKTLILSTYALVVFYLPALAHAKLSDRGQEWSSEASLLITEIVFWFKVAGIGLFLFAVYSMIMQKNKQQPLTWEVWGIVGGAVLFVALQIFGDVAGSVSGTDVNVDVQQSTSGGF